MIGDKGPDLFRSQMARTRLIAHKQIVWAIGSSVAGYLHKLALKLNGEKKDAKVVEPSLSLSPLGSTSVWCFAQS